MNEKNIKRLNESHAKILTVLLSYHKVHLTELESLHPTRLMFEKIISEAIKVDAILKHV